jgi:hypothetical protein
MMVLSRFMKLASKNLTASSPTVDVSEESLLMSICLLWKKIACSSRPLEAVICAILDTYGTSSMELITYLFLVLCFPYIYWNL